MWPERKKKGQRVSSILPDGDDARRELESEFICWNKAITWIVHGHPGSWEEWRAGWLERRGSVGPSMENGTRAAGPIYVVCVYGTQARELFFILGVSSS